MLSAFLVLQSCQTPFRKDCEDSRSPSSEGCGPLFRKSQVKEHINAPDLKALQNFFSQLEKQGFRSGDFLQQISGQLESLKHQNGIFKGTYAEYVLHRDKQGYHGQDLLEQFGFRISGKSLISPSHVELLFYHTYMALEGSAKRFGLTLQEMLLPALPMKLASGETVWIRPGIDAVPKGGTYEKDLPEVSVKLYFTLVGENKFPWTFSHAGHDLGHFMDQVDSPLYAPAYRLLALQMVEVPIPQRGDFDEIWRSPWLNDPQRAFQMQFFLNEWTYLPNPQAQLTADRYLLSKPLVDLVEAQSIAGLYLKSEWEKVKTISEHLIAAQNIYFNSHGGGTRDTNYLRRGDGVTIALEMLTGRSARKKFHDKLIADAKAENDVFANEMPAMMDLLGVLLRAHRGDSLNSWHELTLEAGRAGTRKSRKAYIEQLIRLLVGKIDQKFRTGIFLQLTPARIADDIRLLLQSGGQEAYMKSPTYLYYSLYPGAAYQRFLWTDF